MAESRREKRFLRLSIFCTGSAANAAITGPLVRGDDGPWFRGNAGPWFRAMPAPWFGGHSS